jgi:oligosaccharide repeat unit polymerase
MNDLNDIIAIPAYFLAALLVWAIFADVRHDLCRLVSGRNVVLAAIGVWYLLEAIMVPKELRTFTQEQYNFGILHVGLAVTGFLVAYHFTSGCPVFPAMGEKITFFDDERWIWRLVLIGAIVGFAPIVILTGTQFTEAFQGMMGQRATWGGMLGRGRYGDARAAFLTMEMFVGGVAPFAAILLFSRQSSVVQKGFCALVIAWPILRSYGSATRSSMLLAVGCSVLAILYWKMTPVWRKRMIYAGFASLPLMYALMAAIVVSRGSGALSWENAEKVDYVGNEMFRELLFITSKVPSLADYQYGYVYFVQLVNPIPRFLWPGKPSLDAGLLMASMHGALNSDGEAYLTCSPGLIGEMYLNFGTLGIIGLSLFGGWLVKGWDLILKLYSHSLPALMFYSGGLGVLFVMGRSFTMTMFYGLISLALLAWLISSFASHSVANVSVPLPAEAEE